MILNSTQLCPTLKTFTDVLIKTEIRLKNILALEIEIVKLYLKLTNYKIQHEKI